MMEWDGMSKLQGTAQMDLGRAVPLLLRGLDVQRLDDLVVCPLRRFFGGVLDDTGLPKRSRMIKACSWLRDPLGPRFQTNFGWGLRCLHAIVHLPPQHCHAHALSTTGRPETEI